MAGEPTAYEIVPVTPEVAEDFLAVDQAAFFFEHSRPAQEALASLDLTRYWAATRTGGPPFAGIYGSFDMTVTIPAPAGGLHAVPMAGLTWVGVHPDERRRGVLSPMIRHHFEDLHQQGAAVSGLHASEPGIYGRFGYAVASLDAFVTLPRGQALHAPAFEEAAAGLATRMVPLAADGVADQVHDLHVRFMGAQLGAVVRTPRMTQAQVQDFPPGRQGREASQVLFAEREGQLRRLRPAAPEGQVGGRPAAGLGHLPRDGGSRPGGAAGPGPQARRLRPDQRREDREPQPGRPAALVGRRPARRLGQGL